MRVSLALQMLLSFTRSHLIIVDRTDCTLGVRFRKSFPVPREEDPMEISNHPGYCSDKRLLSLNWEQCPLAEDNTHDTHWIYRSWVGAYMEPYTLVIFVWESTLSFPKRNLDTNSATKLLTCILFCLHNMLGNGGIEFVGVANQCLISPISTP